MTVHQDYKENLVPKDLRVLKDLKETLDLLDSQESEENQAHKASRVNQDPTDPKVVPGLQVPLGQWVHQGKPEKLGCPAIL